MLKLMLVFLGGGLGSTLRYLLSCCIHTAARSDENMPPEEAAIGLIPLGTLAVNILGCFLIGLAIPLLAQQRDEWRLLIVVGLLGGFTTFSAFGLESITLLKEGHAWIAAAYAIGSVIAGIIAAAAGAALSGKPLPIP